MRQLIADARSTLRVLRRNPGLTLLSIVTLALGIGASTAIFSLVQAVLLRPLPLDELDRLLVIREDLPQLELFEADLAPPEVVDLAALTDVFAGMTGFQTSEQTLTGSGEPVRVSVASTLGDFFGVFGVRPHAGGFYRPEHSTEGPARVAVIGEGLWRRLGGTDAALAGASVRLDGIAYDVVGVAPPELHYPRDVQIWVPFVYDARWSEPGARGRLMMTAVARVRPGITEERVRARLHAEVTRWNEQYHAGSSFGKVLTSTDFIEYLAGPLRRILLVLVGAVAFVLMIAAANVAALQLVHAAARSKEIAVRAALGAGSRRIARQLLLESLALGASATLLGIIIGVVALELIQNWEPARRMYLTGLTLDATVLALTAAAAALAAAVAATLPALRAARVDPQQVLRDTPRGASASPVQQRMLRAAVVVQVALALLLVLGSALMVRTLSRLLAAEPGFSPEDVTTAQVSIPETVYDTPEKAGGFFDALLARLRASPGVEDAALVWGLPLTGQGSSSPFELPRTPPSAGEPARHAEGRFVSPGYFRTMRIPVLRGREFTDADRRGSPLLIVIDRTFAEQFFPGEDPIGQPLSHFFGPGTIVGVVDHVDHDEIGDAPKATAYYSFGYNPSFSWRSIVVRSERPAPVVAGLIREAVAELDPDVPIYDVQTMNARIAQSLGPRRLAMLVLGGFAALALVLAALGIYGVMRYTTDQRTHEFGIRMALGAQPGDVVRMVIRQGAVVAGVGVAIGIASALVLTRFMQAVLFGVSPHDPLAFIAAPLLLGAVALVATWLPARRATRVPPVQALRVE